MSSFLFQAANTAGMAPRGRSVRMGQTEVHRPQRTQASPSITGRAKPSRSRTMAMASWGQMLAQAVQPVQRDGSASRGRDRSAAGAAPVSSCPVQGRSSRAQRR